MSKCMGLVGVGLVAAALGFVVAPASGQKTATKDTAFMQEAAGGGMCEVKLGQLALEKSSNDEVKGFAKRMIDDHSKGNRELTQIAGSKNVDLPKDLDKKNQALRDKLAQLQGKEFDKEYMRHMLEDHEEDVGKFEQASKFVQDSDLKAWVGRELPVLKEHLRIAKEIHAKIEKKDK